MRTADRPLDVDSLRCFLAASELLSFRTAARRVALSPPAFSDRIKQLEEELGVALFVRTTRSVKLTAAGERLVPAARAAIDASVAARAAVRGDERMPYDLTVGTRFELGMSWLVPALSDLERAAPERTLHLVFGDSPELLWKTRAGDVDATVSSQRLANAGFDYALLHEERYVLVAHPSLLERSPLRGPDDARAHTLLDAHADLPLFRYFLDGSPREETWSFARHERLGTIAAIRARVVAKKGVAVLPRYLVDDDVKRGRLSVLFAKRKLPSDFFRLIWRRGHPKAELLRGLAEELRSLPLQ